MKIIILTQYFPPEVGAPQNRLYELAIRLQKMGAQVTVLTAMPNYPQMKVHENYRGKFYVKENLNGLTVHRSWIYVTTDKGIFKRLLNYFSFVITSFWIGMFKLRKSDFIICESPPLFLGITAYFLKLFKRSKLVFNVSDLWPESAEKLGLVTNKTMLKLATVLEEFLYRKSDLISGQTQGIVKDISARNPTKKIHWLPNGVDLNLYNHNELQQDWRIQNNFNDEDFLLLYAGIIGHAQGLEIIPKAAQLLKDYPHIKFIVLGSGPVKNDIVQLTRSLLLTNVFFFDAVTKKEMPAIVSACDVALIPLKKLDLFKGAIPSKIFENLAMKKPILLGVEGEAKDLFIDEGQCGLAFEPENESDLTKKILELQSDKQKLKQYGENGLSYVKTKFTRDLIASDFYKFLKENI